MKSWVKPIAAFLLIGIVLAESGYSMANLYIRSHWTTVYRAELDRFFGRDHWECTDRRTESSAVYKTRDSGNKRRTMRYQVWDIQFDNAAGGEASWSVTNLTLKLSQKRYYLFHPRRYSNKQALTLELMDIAKGLACEEIYRDIIRSELTEKEAECIRVLIMHKGGNPRPEFYSKLLDKEWFTVEGVSAEKFLSCEEHDFYIDILAFDWEMEKLTEAERQHIYDSIGSMEKSLLGQFGESASFNIYLSEEYQVEYADGRKQ